MIRRFDFLLIRPPRRSRSPVGKLFGEARSGPGDPGPGLPPHLTGRVERQEGRTQHSHRAGRHHHQRTLAPAQPAPLHPTPGNYAPVLARPDAPHDACQPRLQPVMPPFLRLRVATAPAGLETPPTSAKTMPMVTVRLIGCRVQSRRPTNGTAPPFPAPGFVEPPKREPGFQRCSAHTWRLCSRLASPARTGAICTTSPPRGWPELSSRQWQANVNPFVNGI